MGKKYVIMEVKLHPLYEDRYSPVGMKQGDDTVIDPRYVIDGDRLHYGFICHNGQTLFSCGDGWTVGPTESSLPFLILDPAKPEGNLNDHIEFGKALDNALDKWHRGNGIGYLVNVLKERRKP